MEVTSLNASLTLLLILGWAGWACDASPAPPSSQSYPRFPMMTTTTDSPASLVLDDPANSATTSENTDQQQWEEICYKCLDKVQLAQDNTEIYENMSRKQKKLLAQMKAAAEASAASIEPRRPSRLSKNTRSTVFSGANSTVMTRNLQTEELKVVSVLRVGRAADQSSRSRNKDKYVMNKKDAELERLKREQQQQKDRTCSYLNDLRDCLDSISHECIGFLHYHLYDVFAEQWHGKLRCPYPNNPNIRPFVLGTGRSLLSDDPKLGVARPIPPSEEEVRQRMHEILPSRQFPKPPGVILKPTFNNQATTQQQVGQSSDQQSKGPYQSLTRDFSGHQYRVHPLRSDMDDDSVNVVNIGKILLVPCCFAVMVALLALVSLHYKTSNSEEEEDETSETNAREFQVKNSQRV